MPKAGEMPNAATPGHPPEPTTGSPIAENGPADYTIWIPIVGKALAEMGVITPSDRLLEPIARVIQDLAKCPAENGPISRRQET
jgi:hypothetical protein